MEGYKISITEKNQLEGTEMSTGSYYNPVEDINGEWFIFEEEYMQCGLGVLAEFEPKPSETII